MASSKKSTPSLDALRKMRPKTESAPAPARAPAGISLGGAAGVAAEEQRFTMRIPAEDQEILKPIRAFLMNHNRKVIEGRIFLAAIRLALDCDASVFGIVGRDGGTTAQLARACVVIPPLFPDHITPHTEGLCAVVWHLLVSHPALARVATRWESLK